MPDSGDILAAKYRLIRSIGKGGMGEVFEAEHSELGKRVAIKIPTPELLEDPRNLERFKQEPRVAAATGHRCIVDVYDIGTTDDGVPFVVMEYLEGESFADLIQRVGRVEEPLAIYVVCQVLSALAAAHSKKIIHRDLKPENVFLVRTGQELPDVKVIDFGTSKVVAGTADAPRLTQSGTILGTPYYMAPEQIRAARHLDHRLDIYAVGVMLYEAVTGQVPFDSENVYTLVHMVLHDELIPPRVYSGELNAELEQVILKAMDRDREQRYRSAEAMVEALLPFLDDRSRVRVLIPETVRSAEPPPAEAGPAASPSPAAHGTATTLPAIPSDLGSDEALILGRYALVKKLGRDGTRTTYLARRQANGSPVQIQVLHPHLMDSRGAVRAFVQEAKLVTRLVHSNIVRLVDYGEDGGHYVIVLEHVQGYSLASIMTSLSNQRRKLNLEHAAYIAYRLLLGLGFAHGLTDEHGTPLSLIHRNVRPNSVMITLDGQVKLCDFDVLPEVSSTSASAKGDFAYMSPEQVTGAELDHRSDLFSVGILLHELLSGHSLFGAGNDALTITRVSKCDAPDIRLIRPDLPEETSALLSRVLKHSPDDRYSEATTFASDLRELFGGASLEEIELTFRATITELFNAPEFKAASGELIDLKAALTAKPITLAPRAVGPAADAETETSAPRRSPLKLLIPIATLFILLGGASGLAYFAIDGQSEEDDGPQRPVALIIDKQTGVGGATTTGGGATTTAPTADDAGADAMNADAESSADTGPNTDAESAAADAAPSPSKTATQPPPVTLTGRIVTRALMRRQAALMGCIRRHDGQINAIRLVIDRSGRVTSASVEPAAVSSTPLGRCIISVARAVRLPPHRDPSATFRVPVRLSKN